MATIPLTTEEIAELRKSATDPHWDDFAETPLAALVLRLLDEVEHWRADAQNREASAASLRYALREVTDKTKEEVASQLDFVERARALLKQIEWSIRKPGDWDGRYCPACDAWDGDDMGHKDGCALAALLGRP